MHPLISRSTRAVLALLVALMASPLALASSASAAPASVSAGTLDWGISSHVATSASLNGARSAGAPATDDGTEWHFTGGTGEYDPDTGELDLALPGSLEFGNAVRGNYGFRLTNVSVHVDDAGDGRIEADVTVRPSFQPYGTPVTDVTIVTFSDAVGVADDDTVSWTITPDTEPVPAEAPPAFAGAQQFPETFLDAVTADFESHFRQTGDAGADDAANIVKLPSAMTFSVDHVATDPGGDDDPTVTVAPSTELDPAGDTVSIAGGGFGSESDGVYVRLCAEADGEIGTPAGRPGADRCLGDPQLWVSNFPGASAPMGAGTFDVELAVVGAFTGSEGAAFDCSVDQCGIATRRDHFGGADDYSLDTFTPVTFASPTDPDPTDPDPTDPDPTDPAPVEGDGALDWGVKESFRNYIERGPAAGTIETTAPAERNEDGTFRFDLGSGLDFVDGDDVFAPFEGGVRFSGHAGALDLVITEPRIDIDGTTGTLVVDAVSKELESPEAQTFDDVVMATLDLRDISPTDDDGSVRYAEIPATLTEDGADAFGGFYEAGEALDPVTFVVAADTSGLDPTPPAPDDSVGCVPATVTAGQSVDVCGEGFTPGEQVQVFLHSDPIFLTVVEADAVGDVAAPVVIPADATGVHRIELRGVTSGRNIFSDTFTVTAATSRSVGSGTLPVTGMGTGLIPIALAAILVGAFLVRVAVREQP